jgi:hypothetical protein
MNYVLPKPITVELDDHEIQHIEVMAKEIFYCPVRRKNRQYEEVYNATLSGVILEFALVRQGAIKNNAVFDEKNQSSYDWDVIWNNWRSEIKCTADPDKMPENAKMKWVTFPLSSVQTFINNITRNPNCVDIIIFGCYDKISENKFECKWRLVAPADSFKSSTKKCNPKWSSSYYKKTGALKYFYNHFSESLAIYNTSL